MALLDILRNKTNQKFKFNLKEHNHLLIKLYTLNQRTAAIFVSPLSVQQNIVQGPYSYILSSRFINVTSSSLILFQHVGSGCMGSWLLINKHFDSYSIGW